jgi:DNA-binding NarL/FixJ family response regulator
MTSILIVEDHVLMGRALVRIIEDKEGLKVVDVVQTGEAAIEKLDELDVDLVLVDVSLPTMSGIDLVIKLHESHPQLPCIMLSGHNALQYVTRSLSAGARGYVVKDDIPGLFEGIRSVLGGEIYVSEGLR